MAKISVLCLAVFGFAVAGGHAAEIFVLPFTFGTFPDHPNECFYKDTNKFYKANSTNEVPGECLKIQCNTDLSMTIKTCDPVAAVEGCVLKSDLSKSYPQCCSTCVFTSTTEATPVQASETPPESEAALAGNVESQS